jgi:hypothetical protein
VNFSFLWLSLEGVLVRLVFLPNCLSPIWFLSFALGLGLSFSQGRLRHQNMPSVRTMCVTSDSTSTDVCTFVLCAIRPQGSLVLLTFQRGEQQITVHLERRMPDLEVCIFVCGCGCGCGCGCTCFVSCMRVWRWCVCVCVCVTVVCVSMHAFTRFLCNAFLLLTS